MLLSSLNEWLKSTRRGALLVYVGQDGQICAQRTHAPSYPAGLPVLSNCVFSALSALDAETSAEFARPSDPEPAPETRPSMIDALASCQNAKVQAGRALKNVSESERMRAARKVGGAA